MATKQLTKSQQRLKAANEQRRKQKKRGLEVPDPEPQPVHPGYKPSSIAIAASGPIFTCCVCGNVIHPLTLMGNGPWQRWLDLLLDKQDAVIGPIHERCGDDAISGKRQVNGNAVALFREQAANLRLNITLTEMEF